MKILPSYKISFLIVLISFLLSVSAYYYRYIFDFTSPAVNIEALEEYLPAKKYQLNIEAYDKLAGLDAITVRTYQNGRIIFQESVKVNGEKLWQGAIELPLEKLKHLSEIRLELSVFDRSLWLNNKNFVRNIKIDNKAPELKTHTTSVNSFAGSINPVVYQAKDQQLTKSGLKTKDDFFPGYPLENYDKIYAFSDYHLGFFYLPLDNETKQGKVKVIATDSAGNQSAELVSYKFFPQKRNQKVIKLTDENLGVIKQQLKISNEDSEKIAKRYQSIIKVNQTEIAEAANKFAKESYLTNVFSPAIGSVYLNFFNQVNYQNKNLTTDLIINNNAITYITNSEIKSLAAGRVIYLKELPVWGNTLAIYHGFGISSVFTNLKEAKVSLNQVVSAEELLALPGELFFTGKTGYRLETLLAAQPFNPGTLWDQSWFKSHFLSRINQIKESL